jgi:hypothetical protein
MKYKIKSLIERFENIKDTQPNISNVWIQYLSKKMDNLENDIIYSDKLLTEIEKNKTQYNDFPLIMILLLLNK